MVHAANGDITAYLPTNIMSITDGQWILDMDIFRSGIRPAMNIGLSVTRAGGVGHNKRQKNLAAQTLKTLADYRQAEEFSHFGSELAVEAKRSLVVGKHIFEVMTQGPNDTYPLMAQQLMMDVILNLPDGEEIDINALKVNANAMAELVTSEDNYEAARDQLKAKAVVELKGAPAPAVEDKPAPPPLSEKDQKKADKETSKRAEKDAKETAEKDKVLAGAAK
jgi:F-type H+-transporting ATPase subunit alpha